MTEYSQTAIWVLVGLAALGTWLLRLSFIALLGRDTAISATTTRILGLIPAAVLAALVAPSLTRESGSFDLVNVRLVAGIAAAIVAWRTKNVIATIATGMSVLWLVQALV